MIQEHTCANCLEANLRYWVKYSNRIAIVYLLYFTR